MIIGAIGHGFWPLVGGLERQIQDCAIGWVRRGCQVRVLSIVGEGSQLPAREQMPVRHASTGPRHRDALPPIEVRRAPVLRPSIPTDPLSEPEIPVDAYRKLVPGWARELADVDVLVTFGASPAIAGGLLKARLGLPLIAVLPGIPDIGDRRFDDVLRCDADVFVTVSRFMRERARRLFDLHTLTIYNGIDTAFFRPVRPRRLAATAHLPGPLITAPVRLDPAKDVELLIDAFDVLHALRPDATLLITGNGSICHELGLANPYYEYLQERVALKELDYSVRFARGSIAANHMPALYSRSDVCVMASRTEGFGLSLAESMACGTPVVATRTEGMAEVFTDGAGGVFVDSREPTDIAQCLLTLLGDEHLRRRLGATGRRHVQRAFPVQQQADRYLELLHSLCACRRAA
ncbi:MAG: glycosyltransferase family 4 protein [Gemmatimonadetes bacterium]|jgi:glycosyltransferase involved in cell wall biosynthesis|nr:glycosyltransferase family 4 protein [Gemmatimonadota bacterium]MBT6145048.1 glycosyltransferase family 4 protein [Gemmatimonadota bacterium]MBT7862722.1 glycosyltransferase family 4 protein [Gemmatimonadota bacterium]